MRVIGGKWKSRKINEDFKLSHNKVIRPTSDRVKENIFNILEHSKKINIQIKESIILDLYSGSGSFGLESLSRYASKVSFVEKDLDALTSLKKNIENLKIQEKINLYEEEVSNFFDRLDFNEKFDIIFIDPPYSDKKFTENIKAIRDKNILNKDYIIIIHRERKSSENFEIKNLNIIEEKIYGRSQIFFVKFF